MKVQFINAENTDFDGLGEQLESVLVNTVKNLQDDKGVDVVDAVFVDAEFTIGVKVAGIEEPQYLTVEHHEGVPEMFKWVVDLESGTTENNEEASFFDSWSVAKYKGAEQQFETIESIYNEDELDIETTENFGDMSKHVYEHEDGFKVGRVFQGSRLVQEYKMIPKEETAE